MRSTEAGLRTTAAGRSSRPKTATSNTTSRYRHAVQDNALALLLLTQPSGYRSISDLEDVTDAYKIDVDFDVGDIMASDIAHIARLELLPYRSAQKQSTQDHGRRRVLYDDN
jgi:hypothetical protein